MEKNETGDEAEMSHAFVNVRQRGGRTPRTPGVLTQASIMPLGYPVSWGRCHNPLTGGDNAAKWVV